VKCKVHEVLNEVEFEIMVTQRYVEDIARRMPREVPNDAFIIGLLYIVRSRNGILMRALKDNENGELICEGNVRFVLFRPAAGKNEEAPRRLRTKTS
jgi:hypothetical protein